MNTLLDNLKKDLQQLLVILGIMRMQETQQPLSPGDNIQPQINPPTTPPLNLVSEFCVAIQTYEGYLPPCAKYPNGTPAYQNKNPGNIRCSAGKPSSLIAIGCSAGNFNIYPSYEVGFQDLENNTIAVAKGERTQYGYYPTMTLLEYFTHRDPPSDNNNPADYAQFVANQLKVGTDFQIKDLIA